MYFSSLQKWDVQTSDRFVRESICCQIFAKRIYARDNPSLEAASSSLLLHIYIYTYIYTYIHIAEPNLIEYISLSSWQCYERWLPIIFTSKSIRYFIKWKNYLIKKSFKVISSWILTLVSTKKNEIFIL